MVAACFHRGVIRIYFMFFIVQISPFVYIFTLKIVFRWWANPEPPHQQGSSLLEALTDPQTPPMYGGFMLPQRCFPLVHFTTISTHHC
jgi:hypothetical protein